jgi:hypothetical protein
MLLRAAQRERRLLRWDKRQQGGGGSMEAEMGAAFARKDSEQIRHSTRHRPGPAARRAAPEDIRQRQTLLPTPQPEKGPKEEF